MDTTTQKKRKRSEDVVDNPTSSSATTKRTSKNAGSSARTTEKTNPAEVISMTQAATTSLSTNFSSTMSTLEATKPNKTDMNMTLSVIPPPKKEHLKFEGSSTQTSKEEMQIGMVEKRLRHNAPNDLPYFQSKSIFEAITEYDDTQLLQYLQEIENQEARQEKLMQMMKWTNPIHHVKEDWTSLQLALYHNKPKEVIFLMIDIGGKQLVMKESEKGRLTTIHIATTFCD